MRQGEHMWLALVPYIFAQRITDHPPPPLSPLQLFHDPHKIIATLQNDGMGTYPDMEGADNLYTCLLCCLELFAATLLPGSWIKSRKKSLMTLQLTIVVGFWIAMVLVSQLPIETTFMRLDRNMAECKADFNCWWEDEEKWESLKKELLGHCFIQVLAFSAIGLNVPNGKMSVSRIRGMVEVFMVWIAIVAGAGVASGGGVPYLSAPANANK